MTKRKLNLLAIAKQSEKDFQEVELTINGETFTEKVYKVPNPVIWTYKPNRPEPQEPTVLMTADVSGRRQSRPLKESDEGWSEYQKALADYENESDNIQNAARYVLSLADITYPDLNQPPPLAKKNGVEYPENEILRKKLWLDYTLFLEQSNMLAIQAIMTKFLVGNVTDDKVEEVKKNLELDTTESQ